MNTIYIKLSALAAFLCLIISCQKEDIMMDECEPGYQIFTFSAEYSPASTKTIRQEDGAVWWDTDESIKIFCNGVSGKFTSTNTKPAPSASFTGSFNSTIKLEDITTYGVTAIYPYDDNVVYEDGEYSLVIPSEQVAAKGTFGKGMFPCIATATGTNLEFQNICCGVMFTVYNPDIKSVTFKGNDSEMIAGKITVDYLWDDLSSHIVDGKTEITVYAPNSGCFEPGEPYYIVMVPPAAPTYYFLKGFTITYNKEGVSDAIIINESLPLPRSKFGKIEMKDKELLFIDNNKPIKFADQIIEEQCVSAFDTNGDGELSYAEAAMVTDLSKMTLSNKSFKSFDELQYFINVKAIPYGYFKECSNLNSIVLPDGITSIRSSAFYKCSSLTEINLPAGITEIEDFTFDECSNLTSIKLPDGITRIGEYAF